MKNTSSPLLGFASRVLPMAVLAVILLWSWTVVYVPHLRPYSESLLSFAVALLAIQMLLAGPSRSEEPALPSAREEELRADPPSTAASETRAESSSLSPHLDLREVREDAERRIKEIERRLSEERRQRKTADLDSSTLAQANAVRHIAEELAIWAENAGESASSVRSLREMMARLKAMTVGSEEINIGEQIPSLKPAEEWLGKSGARPVDYLWYLAAQMRQAQDLLEAYKGISRSPKVIDWRTEAEALLLLVGQRRSAPGEGDPASYRRLHEALLGLLGYREITVNLGDAINRDLHGIETSKPTDELPPNRVLEVLTPGYVDERTDKVWRKATVVMSEQRLL